MKKLWSFLLLVGALSAADTPARPNILWILGDDLGTELGCYGNPDVRTPHLDRLAGEGVRYTRFYTTAPVCSASRSAFMTGMYAQSIRAHNHRTAKKDKQPLPAGVRVLTDWFRDAGYLTANLVEFPPELGFKATGKTDWNFVYDGQPFDMRRWADLVESKKPFWAQINFNEPHRLFKAPHTTDPSKVTLPPFYPDLPAVRTDWAGYLDDVAQLDRKVGAVLARLQADGLADNTIVIFFGDNGRCHARDKQFCYEEGLRVPLLIRWPKNFPAPAGFVAGQVSDRLLAAIDLGPTLLSLVGAPVPPTMQGQVFLGAQAAPARAVVCGGRDRCDETEIVLRTARDARYRYILNLTPGKSLMSPNEYKATEYPAWNLLKALAAEGKATPAQALFAGPTAPAEELYDLETDPGQLHNLAADPACQAVKARLAAALQTWRQEIHDPAL